MYNASDCKQSSWRNNVQRNVIMNIHIVSKVPRQGGQAAASIHFSDGGGGGGGKS